MITVPVLHTGVRSVYLLICARLKIIFDKVWKRLSLFNCKHANMLLQDAGV